MPANEFEKQVQDQLGEFQLNPSASVWKKVEEQIRGKKRRRIIFFFLLPVVFGLLGIAYYYLYTGKKTGTAQQAVAMEKKNSLLNDQNTISIETKEQPAAGQQEEAGKKNITNAGKIISTQKPGAVSQRVVAILTTHPATSQVNKNASAINIRNRIQKQQDNSLEITSNVPGKQKISIAGGEYAGADTLKNAVTQNIIFDKEIQAGDVVIDGKNIVSANTDTIKTGETITPDNKKEAIKLKKPGKQKIKWGIDFSGGLAFNNNGTLTFGRAQAFDMSYYIPGNTTGAGNPTVIIPPSNVRPGPAIRLGVIAEWQVSKRGRFSAGVQYMYASNRIKTGVRSDTVVQLPSNSLSATRADVIYRGTQKNNYTNSYHFVSIPVWYHLQINKGKKLPIQWNAGISLGYMIATNALVYDGTLGGIYYQNKDAFTRLHLNMGTGLSFRIITKNKGEWVIGPELSFDMSRLVKNDNKQYLMFGGINAKVFFPKKKNK